MSNNSSASPSHQQPKPSAMPPQLQLEETLVAIRDSSVEVVPEPDDILCGQPKTFAAHPGNARYQEIIAREADQYHRATTKQARMDMTRRIVTDLRTHHQARFLQLNASAKWYELTDVKARDKVSHALRQYLKRQPQPDGDDAAATTTLPQRVAEGSDLSEAARPDGSYPSTATTTHSQSPTTTTNTIPTHQRMVSDETMDVSADADQDEDDFSMLSGDFENIRDALRNNNDLTVSSLGSLVLYPAADHSNTNTVRSRDSLLLMCMTPLEDSFSRLYWPMEDVLVEDSAEHDAATTTNPSRHHHHHHDPSHSDTTTTMMMHKLQHSLQEKLGQDTPIKRSNHYKGNSLQSNHNKGNSLERMFEAPTNQNDKHGHQAMALEESS